MADNRCNW